MCAVQHAGQAIINAIVVQFPVDFARAITRALTCYRDVLSRFDVWIFRVNTAGVAVGAWRK